jgi:hypothetical protein
MLRKLLVTSIIAYSIMVAQGPSINRSEIYVPFNVNSYGFYTLGLGYRWGIQPDICTEIEGSYGSISATAYDPYTGASSTTRCDAYIAGIAAIYGKGMGTKFQDKTRFGIGARLTPMYINLSAESYYEISFSSFAVVPYLLVVLEIPVLSLEANLALSPNGVAPGFRAGIRF